MKPGDSRSYFISDKPFSKCIKKYWIAKIEKIRNNVNRR